MLEKVKLVNFQNHQTLTVELDPRVTVLVGPSDSGKSSVFRALRFVCLNPPLRKSGKDTADPCVRHGADSCRAVLYLDGRRVIRSRLPKNRYKLDNQIYVSFGTTVPEDVAALINVGPENFQRQFDGPFWFTDTAGQVAKNLNEIVDLSVIDDATSNVTSELRRANAELEVTRDRFQEARAERSRLKWVPAFADGVTRLEVLETRHAEFSRTRSNLAFLVESGSTLTSTLDGLTCATLGALNVKQSGEQLAAVRAKGESLRQLVDQIAKAQHLTRVRTPDVGPLTALRKRCDAAAETRRVLDTIVTATLEEEKRCRQTSAALKKARTALQDFVSSQKICPGCGQPLPNRSPSSAPTSTSATRHRCPDRPNQTGTRRSVVTYRN